MSILNTNAARRSFSGFTTNTAVNGPGFVQPLFIFDLGRPTAVDFVRFALWGSDANPHHVLLQTAPHYLGPWESAAQFTVPLDVHRYDVPVADARAA